MWNDKNAAYHTIPLLLDNMKASYQIEGNKQSLDSEYPRGKEENLKNEWEVASVPILASLCLGELVRISFLSLATSSSF